MKNKIFKVLIIAILSANVVYAESSRKIRISNVPMSKIEEDYKKLGDREDLFIKDKNGVYKYSYGDTAQKLNGIDPKTVEVFNKFYLKDKNGVYYLDKNKIKILNLEGMDLKTLEVVDNSYLKDKNSVYLVQENKLKRLEKIDPNTFKNIGGNYVKDKNGVYKYYFTYITVNDKELKKEPNFDAKTFEIVDPDGRYVKDKNNVYCDGEIINGADPATFEMLKKGNINYMKDKNNIYYWKTKIEGVDRDTFKIMENPNFSKDKNNIYFLGEKTESESYPPEYEKKGNDVYYKNKKLKDIDANTFETMISFFGFKDKNGYYVLDRDGSVVKINDKEVKIKNLAKSSFNSNFFYDGKNLYFIKNHKFEKIKKAPKTDGISEISDRYVEIGKVYYLDYDKGELIKLEKNDGRGVFFALGEDYGKDFNLNAEGVETTRRYIYFKGRILKNADYDSFGIKYNDQKNVFEIRDKISKEFVTDKSKKIYYIQAEKELAQEGSEKYDYVMKQIKNSLNNLTPKDKYVEIFVPMFMITQEEFNTVGNPKMFENSKIIHKFPDLPTERGFEKENNFDRRAVYDGVAR